MLHSIWAMGFCIVSERSTVLEQGGCAVCFASIQYSVSVQYVVCALHSVLPIMSPYEHYGQFGCDTSSCAWYFRFGFVVFVVLFVLNFAVFSLCTHRRMVHIGLLLVAVICIVHMLFDCLCFFASGTM